MKKDERCVTSLPISFSKGNVPEFAERIVGAGETALLGVPQLDLLSSSECHGQVLLETLDLVPQLVKVDRVIISGFHSPLEQQVLRSLLRHNGHAVKVLACCFSASGYRLAKEEQDAFANGRLLIISAFDADTSRITRESAIKRNELVIALSTEVVDPYISKGSPLEKLLFEHNS